MNCFFFFFKINNHATTNLILKKNPTRQAWKKKKKEFWCTSSVKKVTRDINNNNNKNNSKNHLEVDRVYGGAGRYLLYDDDVLMLQDVRVGVYVRQRATGPVLVAEIYVEMFTRRLGRTCTRALHRQRTWRTDRISWSWTGRRCAARRALRRHVAGFSTAAAWTCRHRARSRRRLSLYIYTFL